MTSELSRFMALVLSKYLYIFLWFRVFPSIVTSRTFYSKRAFPYCGNFASSFPCLQGKPAGSTKMAVLPAHSYVFRQGWQQSELKSTPLPIAHLPSPFYFANLFPVSIETPKKLGADRWDWRLA